VLRYRLAAYIEHTFVNRAGRSPSHLSPVVDLVRRLCLIATGARGRTRIVSMFYTFGAIFCQHLVLLEREGRALLIAQREAEIHVRRRRPTSQVLGSSGLL